MVTQSFSTMENVGADRSMQAEIDGSCTTCALVARLISRASLSTQSTVAERQSPEMSEENQRLLNLAQQEAPTLPSANISHTENPSCVKHIFSCVKHRIRILCLTPSISFALRPFWVCIRAVHTAPVKCAKESLEAGAAGWLMHIANNDRTLLFDHQLY
jgi:hypothetical protein